MLLPHTLTRRLIDTLTAAHMADFDAGRDKRTFRERGKRRERPRTGFWPRGLATFRSFEAFSCLRS